MLLSQTIPNLVGGVSQLPPALRLSSQGEVCDNAFPSPIDGLTKRPPTSHVGTLLTSSGYPFGITDPFVHFINRDGVEKYVMVVTNNGVAVFSLTTGANMPVFNQGTVINYFIPIQVARKNIRALTIADTTFLVNTQVTPTMVSSSGFTQNTCPNTETVIWIKQATNSATYAVNISNALAANYTAPATGVVTTTSVATGIVASLSSAGFNTGGGWTVASNGSYISISRNNNVPFACEVLDSLGGTGVAFIQHNGSQIQFSDLPSYAYHGMIQKIVGNFDNNDGVAYYVQFSQSTWVGTPPATIVPGPGVWNECPAPGVLTQITQASMPIEVIRLVDDSFGTVTGIPFQIYFNVQYTTWNIRACGDDTTNGAPSFIGNPINDIFFYQNRVGFLSGVNIIMSESGNYTNFWRTTVLSLLDNDVIDAQAADSRVVQLRWAVPWQQQLILFGDLKQFLVSGNGNPVTPSNISITSTTDYDSNPDSCRPQPIQNLLYFPFDLNGNVGLREYYVEYYTQKHVGRAMTDPVPKYMKGNPKMIASCNSSDLLAMTVDGDAGSLYVYKWLWQGNTLYSADKLQSAWVRWNYDQPGCTSNILGIQFYGQQAYMVVERFITGIPANWKITLETFTVDSSLTDDPLFPNYVTYLDRRVNETAVTSMVYNPVTNQTSFNTPVYLFNPAVYTRYGSNAPTRPFGSKVTLVSYQQDVGGIMGNAVVTGDLVSTAQKFWVGDNYTMRFRFSPFMLREPASQGGPPIGVLNGKTQVRTLTLRALNSGYFRIEINPNARSQYVVPFTGNIIGSNLANLGQNPGMNENIEVRTLIGCNCDQVYVDIVNDTPLPCRLSNAEYEILFYVRAKRS